MRNNDRNYGVDFLRILSMLSIVGIHIIGQGGVLDSIGKQPKQGGIMCLLIYAVMRCSVNTFAMITGYGYAEKKNVKSRSLINLVQTVVFYCITITLVAFLANPQIFKEEGAKAWIKMIFPPAIGHYWYFVSYIILFFSIPFLNRIINTLNERSHLILLGLITVLFSIIPTVGYLDYFHLDNGYSPWWLMQLYFFGAFIKKYGEPFFMLHAKKVLIYLISTVLIFTFLLYGSVSSNSFGTILFGLSRRYNFTLNLISSFCLMCIFSKLKIKKAHKLINYLATASFSVYIIHGHTYFFDYVLKNRFGYLVDYNAIICLSAVVGISIIIYLACICIDYIRNTLLRVVCCRDRNNILYYLDRIINVINTEEKCNESTDS